MLGIVPWGLLTCSTALWLWYLRAWRGSARPAQGDRPAEFRHRQLGRRAMASGLLTVLALAMVIGSSLSWREYPRVYLWLWSLAAWLAVVVLVLACLDLSDSRRQWRHLIDERDAARLALESELREIRQRLDRQDSETA